MKKADFQNIEELVDYSEGGILSKQLLKTATQDVTLFCMAEGTELSEHTSTKDGFVYVLEGNGIFNMEGKDIIMKEGVFIPIRKNVVHSLRANENTSFILSLWK
jgi:quercetin dioxygenase-like cupin family protein